jgi:hypothetical protein
VRDWLTEKVWRMLCRVSENAVEYDDVLRALAGSGLLPPCVVLLAGRRVALSRPWRGVQLAVRDPDTWAFRVYSECLRDPVVAQIVAGKTKEGRRAFYARFRDRARELWR